jgi:hypothetical protein
LPPAPFDQTGTFELPDGIRDGWPLHTQHFREQALGDRQCVIICPVTANSMKRSPPFNGARFALAYCLASLRLCPLGL